jgi:hypothetical protein
MVTSMKISGSTVASAASQQVSCDLDGEIAILHIDKGVYYGLDTVGSRVWELLAEPVTVDVLCETVTAEFDVEEAVCRADLIALLGELHDEKLVVLS